MNLLFRSLMLTILATGLCQAQPAFEARQLHIEAGLGFRQGDPTVYCLMGIGLVRAPRTDNADDVIAAWLSTHPNARVTLVDAPIGTAASETQPAASIQYVWIGTGDDNLNVHLVREGVFPAYVMRDPAGLLRSVQLDQAPPPARLVTDDQYYDFLKRVIEAEVLARQEKKGLWSASTADAPAPVRASPNIGARFLLHQSVRLRDRGGLL